MNRKVLDFRRLFGFGICLLTSLVSAAEISGKVSKVADGIITVSSSSELLPAVGDKLSVFVEIPGVGKASVATGSVSSVKDEIIIAKIEKATGTVKTGQGVAIDSPNPTRRTRTPTRVDDKEIEKWGTVIDPDGDCRIKISPDKVTMTLPPGGHDLWYGSRVAAEKRFNAPRVLRTVKGDFVARVKVTADWKPGKNLASGRRTNAAGLLIWDSPRQYLRHERNVYAPRGALDRQMSWVPPIYDKDEGRLSKWKAEPSTYFRGRTTWLMVQRKGDKLNSWISHDGKDWKFTGTYESQFPDKVQVGILALNGSQSDFTVEFQDFRLDQK